MLERDIVQMYIQKNLQNKFNLKIQYINPEFKTYIKPALSIKFKEISIYGENSNDLILEAQNPELKISLLPVVIKKLDIKHLFADDIHLNIEKDKDGKFNFEKLFDGNSKKNFKLSYENTLLNIKNLHVNTKDLELNKSFKITAAPFMVENNTGKDIIALTAKGQLLTPENTGDFDINLSFKYPLSYENFDKNLINGTCFIYNLDLKILQPYLQKYFDNNIAAFEGFVDFIQLSAEKDENNRNQIIINTKFNNAVFDKKNWKNHIIAAGENKFNAGIALYDNIVGINSAQFKADNINISANGTITLSKKTELNINAEVKDSRAENIAAILPPTLVPEYMTIEKVKTYGVYGNIEGKANIKGKVPRPDITGYINADDVHVLDKSIHKLHKGTVHLTFDKRILNMDILVELPEKQKTEVKGFVYMYREGINNVSVKTTENIDFPLAQKIIVPISKVFNFQLGPIPDMNIISGNGIIDIFIKGSLDFINIDGFSRFNNARLGYNGLYGEVKNAKGNLILNLIPGLRIAAHAGYERGLANNYGDCYLLNSVNAGIDVRWNNLLLITDFSIDGLGPEQWQKDQGISYPYQWKVDLRYGFDTPAFLNAENSIGIRWDGATFGSHSSYGWDSFYYNGEQIGKTASILTVYYNLNW